ncbi:MAG: cell filamentation protein Fic [Moraxellaceae bacterium]|nr:MAG: cell filamentation protein Fic [Moraxellaceae bacterium]
MKQWAWQQNQWPNWVWDSDKVTKIQQDTTRIQGRLDGVGNLLGDEISQESHINALIDDAVSTAAIEGEALNPESVRSSLVNQLGLVDLGLPQADAKTNGQVQLLLDANYNFDSKLTNERLWHWHQCLFPLGAPLNRFPVGAYREDSVVVASGFPPKQTIHFEAPPADRVAQEMKVFLAWFEGEGKKLPGIIFSAIAHLWFVTIHPFGDGNGRIARAIGDLALCKADNLGQRLYSIPSAIFSQRADYYHALQTVQTDRLDITEWLIWYFGRVQDAVSVAEGRIKQCTLRLGFWEKVADIQLNERQRKMLKAMLRNDPREYIGGMTTKKYANLTQCAKQTAAKDLSQLHELGVFKKSEAGGRSTSYQIDRRLLR